MNLATLSTWWTNDCARFGLEGFTLHELRHTYLVLLAMNSVHPKVMQELAGHYSPQITMDIYAHVEYRRQARGCGGHLEGVLEMHVMTRRTPYVFQGVLPLVRRGARFFRDSSTRDDSSMPRRDHKPLTC
ncbi:MAG: tyrosine-type recombinase/integrase [Atopobiaceae bacterium]|nr:tyrosine-type recombinase/integrase [Atopobiaceae bacterium]